MLHTNLVSKTLIENCQVLDTIDRKLNGCWIALMENCGEYNIDFKIEINGKTTSVEEH